MSANPKQKMMKEIKGVKTVLIAIFFNTFPKDFLSVSP